MGSSSSILYRAAQRTGASYIATGSKLKLFKSFSFFATLLARAAARGEASAKAKVFLNIFFFEIQIP